MKFRGATLQLITSAQDVIDELRQYWPLTLRQIYYQLVSRLIIENRLSEYKRLSRILSDARIGGLVPWESMEDRSRSTLNSDGWQDRQRFIDDELDRFLVGYRRDKLQTQDERLEIWLEKDALASIVHRVAFEYCVSVVVARGFSSTSYVNKCRDRIEQDTRPTRVLYFGDFDPSGWEMPDAMYRKLVDQMDVDPDSLVIERCALLSHQIDEYGLPEDPDAMKPGDSRTAKFKQRFGEDVSPVELDAVHPQKLESLVCESIERNLDMDEFQRQEETEDGERSRIDWIAGQVRELVGGLSDIES